ncbi:hypothetical protein COCCADRAFT_104982 [Bipolaris zeicola 26-R-13]|uniref:Aflatoxin regulatory protein domain-containing protein n=1 Tax=Cochliobolus carbonum (strain 26-R-13) TaxID=930089 RepID=W6YFL7_COCC2|nr:uncharacterized protein COCCADRAFT_104982 [Bipolaris zeicola 26-R-13]EUC30031.1 hypothetical protein COCCADRAFT_104982 [Bipolaris zeicola 26-R-13]
MGRPRKSGTARKARVEQREASIEDDDRPQTENQNAPTQPADQDNAHSADDVQQISSSKGRNGSTSTTPSPRAYSSETTIPTVDSDPVSTSEYSFNISTTAMYDNMFAMDQLSNVGLSSSYGTLGSLDSPLNDIYGSGLAAQEIDLHDLQDQQPLAEACSDLGDRSSMWTNNKPQDAFSILNDSPDLNHPSNTEAFSVRPTTDITLFRDHRAPILDPATPELFRQLPLSPVNQIGFQALEPIRPDFSGCECYKLILRLLLQLDDAIHHTNAMKLDTALQMNKDIFAHSKKMLDCSSCTGTQPSQHLLQVLLVDRGIGVLESKLKNKSPSIPARRLSPLHQLTNKFPDKRASILFPFDELSNVGKKDILESAEDCSLLVGGYEISLEKNIFIKKLLQKRLENWASVLEDLQKMTLGTIVNSRSQVVRVMLAETSLKLRRLVGRVELWNV